VRNYINEIFSDQGIEELRRRLGLANQSIEAEGDLDVDLSALGEGSAGGDTFVFDGGGSGQTIPSPIESLPTPPRFVESGGISFPQNISVDYDAITYRVGPDGATVADIIVQFDDVAGASDYSVRYVSQT
jgi:hypothetical protein